MEIHYMARAKEDREHWQQHKPKIWERIEKLIKDIQTNPFSGIGKPEPLKFGKSGYWSRRIDQEYRLVYKVIKGHIFIVQCRYHY